MGVAVFAESENGVFKKSSFEAISYGKDLADKLGTVCKAITINASADVDLGQYGADEVIAINADIFDQFNPQSYAKAVAEAMNGSDCDTLILSQTYSGKSIAPLVAVKNAAALVTGVVDMVDVANGFKVKKSCFSNKAFAQVNISHDKRVLTLISNSYKINELGGSASSTEFSHSVSASDVNTEITGVNKVSGKIPLTEAELVVSGGRGLKGPENWHLVEDLASTIGAATACSKPVADMDWRPHNEHVGQTGLSIKPNLYIAVGISGAIQHLAGVGSSKVICVINLDPEAPFFKAADYGIVGDAFEVMPKLIKRAKELLA